MKVIRWAFFRRTDIPDIVDPDQTYLGRLRIFLTPLFGIYLHKILLPDTNRHLHNHPYSFVSIVLFGGYWEERPGRALQKRRQFGIAYRNANAVHRIHSLTRTPTWTLVFVGRRRQDWGFFTENGYVPHAEYIADIARKRQLKNDSYNPED